jgi:hypothetical protein
MSESWSEVGRHDEDTGQGSTAWSTNGKGDDAAPEASVVTADEGEQAREPVAAAVAGTDSETESTSDEAPAVEVEAVTDADAAEPIPDADPSTAFLSELTRAMRTTAGQERSRVVANTERLRSERVEEIRARETAEAERMRELAAEDQAGIDTWAEAEVARINAEQERRAAALQADLETSLGQHRDLIAQEIERVETAVSTYRTELDSFFEALEQETDPVAIAQLATRRPVLPSLETEPLVAESPAGSTVAVAPTTVVVAGESAKGADAGTEAEPIIEPDFVAEPAAELADDTSSDEALVAEAEDDEDDGAEVDEEAPLAAAAAAAAATEPALVGVMDYAPDPYDPWRDLPEKAADEPEPAIEVGTSATADADGTADDSINAEAAVDTADTAPRGRSVLQAVPALRPMGSWLGRHANSDRPDIHG